MKSTYRYTACGSAAGGQTWEVNGTFSPDSPSELFQGAMEEVFGQLTQGKAVYGQPGIGCSGPYTLDRFLLVRDKPRGEVIALNRGDREE